LLARVTPRGIGRSDQEFRLRGLEGIASDAAACALQSGATEKAAELLERGRGLLLSQALDAWTDLTTLTNQYPELARQFVTLRDELNAPADEAVLRLPQKTGASDDVPGRYAQIDRRFYLSRQFDEVVIEIRSKSSFERFLMPPSAGSLTAAAQDGPIVLLSVSDIRSDALLLTPEGVDVVRLPELTPSGVKTQVDELLGALQNAQDPTSDQDLRDGADERLLSVLGWLWDVVAGPVLDALGLTEPPLVSQPWARLWWCPSGLLSLLPLHAAGHYTNYLSTKTVAERVISSYTPTVQGLIHARRAVRIDGQSPGRIVVVAMPSTPDASNLPGVESEVTTLQQRFGADVITLADPEATYQSVMAALPQCRWAHFACHGISDIDIPSASHLLLHDHKRQPLTVLDVSRLRLEQAQLAFLSACGTARIGQTLTDEAIHLASAFQLAGYRHVIGTMWATPDRPAARVAAHVYGALVGKSIGMTESIGPVVAEALHGATRRLQLTMPGRPSVWAAHIHIGP
jgi:hypothetical protein